MPEPSVNNDLIKLSFSSNNSTLTLSSERCVELKIWPVIELPSCTTTTNGGVGTVASRIGCEESDCVTKSDGIARTRGKSLNMTALRWVPPNPNNINFSSDLSGQFVGQN